jgi:hypothetical protein
MTNQNEQIVRLCKDCKHIWKHYSRELGAVVNKCLISREPCWITRSTGICGESGRLFEVKVNLIIKNKPLAWSTKKQ